MREILFRGKRLDGGGWVYGDLMQDRDTGKCCLFAIEYHGGDSEVEKGFFVCPVDPATVGQYTGLKDRNGKKIFEGDIVKTKEFGRDTRGLNHPGHDTFVVIWFNAAWCIENSRRRFRLSDTDGSLERIGNRWDNPELLQEAQYDD